MKEVKILGVVVGYCNEIEIIEDDEDINFYNFVPNERLYEIFPDFPKKFNGKNTLIFDFVEGKIYLVQLTKLNWERIYEIKIDLNNFKGA